MENYNLANAPTEFPRRGPGITVGRVQRLTPDETAEIECDRLRDELGASIKSIGEILDSLEPRWLVNNGKQGAELRYRTWRDGVLSWT